MEKPRKVLHEIEVRFKDIDSMGHVNNVVCEQEQ
jgi:acyl-CoA thioesterase FadM